MKTQRILILITQLERAGAQKAAFTLADYLHAQGHSVTLAFLYDKEGWMAEAQANSPYTVLDFKAKTPSLLQTLWRTPLGLLKLKKYLQRHQIETLFTLTPYSNIFGIAVGWWAGVPVRVSSQRGALKDTHPLLLQLDAAVANSALVSQMTAVSKSTRDFCVQVEGIRRDKLTVIANGIYQDERPIGPTDALRHALGIPAGDKICLTVARLHRQKGLDYLVASAEIVLRSHPNTTFLLAGEGEMRAELQKMIDAPGLTGRVRLLGNRKDVSELLALADLFVFPTLYEGMSNALLEAMAATVPIVTTAVEGTAELITDQRTGRVVPPMNSAALADAIDELLNNPTRAAQLAAAAHAYVVENYSVQQFCEQHEQLFVRLLAGEQLLPAHEQPIDIDMLPTVPILGVDVNTLTVPLLHKILAQMVETRRKSLVLHVNAHAFNLTFSNSWLAGFWNSADVVFCDGSGVKIGAKMLDYHIPMRITYADWMWQLAEFAAENDYSLYFLGAREGVATNAAKKLQERYPTLRIVGTSNGYFSKQKHSAENQAIVTKINAVRPDILVVGFGMPVQEKWLRDNWDDVDATVALTAGAVFDYISGDLQRAPTWMTDYTLEWLGRLVIEPRRLWRRYLVGNPLFLLRIVHQRIFRMKQRESIEPPAKYKLANKI